MTTVLWITANPHDHDTSYGMAVGQQFVQAYLSANPDHEVIHLDLFAMNVPQLDADVFRAWRKLEGGASFATLSEVEQGKVGRIGELVDQFVSADKYVFVTPIWNYSYPPVMKAYIDAICIVGKTFKYMPDIGRVGLLKDKKAVHIQASGSRLSPGSQDAELEMGHRHMKVIAEFMGIPSLASIFVEGMAELPDQAQVIKEKALQQARELALTF